MNHLAEAKLHAERATGANGAEWAQLNAQLAIAHVGIAICERMDRAAKDAELEAERKEQWQEYLDRREMGIAL